MIERNIGLPQIGHRLVATGGGALGSKLLGTGMALEAGKKEPQAQVRDYRKRNEMIPVKAHAVRSITDTGTMRTCLNVRMTFFIGAAFNFFLATNTPERLPFKALAKIGMRRASYEIHGPAADRTKKSIIRVEVLAVFYTHDHSPYWWAVIISE